jgi:pimeloyl-ACP methyl ester carboxylesterase
VPRGLIATSRTTYQRVGARLSCLSTDPRVRVAGGLIAELRCGLSAAGTLLSVRDGRSVPGAQGRQVRWGSLPEPPVLLVHGLGADRSGLTTMERNLHGAGYTVHNVSYSYVGTDVERCAANLEREAAWLLAETGSDRLHVVAHSLGGVVLRWAVAHTHMREWVHVAVTLGSPHRGTPVALLAPSGLAGFGTIVRQLRPGLLRFDDGGLGAGTVRWVAVSGQHDWVVPSRYAELPAAANVRNVLAPGVGHMGMTTSRHCLQIILEELAAVSRVGGCPAAA